MDERETPDRDGAFPRLSEEQLGALAARGARRPTRAGEILFREGEPQERFFVVASGLVAIVDGYGQPGERVIAVHGEGRFLGELGLLTGQTAFFTAVVREPGEVVEVPIGELRALITQDNVLGDLVLRAYVLRREWLIGIGAGFRLIGSRFSPDARRLREFAARNRLPHRWIDVEADQDVEALLRRLGVAPEETPVVVLRGEVLRNPSNEELARAVGLRAPLPAPELCDLLVVGAGPAGLAASVYGAADGLATVTLDGMATGGQAATSSKIENYLGFPSGISGGELAERATLQAAKFGVEIAVPAEATGLEPRDGHIAVRLADGQVVGARTVIVATGARYRRLPVPRLEELESSIYYAATIVEARMCAGDPIVVVGGGNSAGQATVFLARHAVSVRLLVREDTLTANMSRYLADRIERLPGVEVLLGTEVRELVGERYLEAVVAEDTRTGERRTIGARALFVFIGADPHTGWLRGSVALDSRGYVLTGPEAAPHGRDGDGAPPLLLETSVPGVFAVGDVRNGSAKRVAAAVGEGAMSVWLVHEHLVGGR